MQKLAVLTTCLLIFANTYSQVTISGPACVTQGTQYQYIVKGADSTVSVQVCVTGGLVLGAGSTCITANGLSQVQVTWDSGTTSSGTVALTAGASSQTLNVNIIAPLAGGSLDTSVLTQFIDSAATPAAISCTAASGGACSPNFIYQWQQSPDNLTWVADSAATGQNLSFPGPILQTTYYRRQAYEATSGSYAYSGVAVVFLNQPGTAYSPRGKLFGKKCLLANATGTVKPQHS